MRKPRKTSASKARGSQESLPGKRVAHAHVSRETPPGADGRVLHSFQVREATPPGASRMVRVNVYPATPPGATRMVRVKVYPADPSGDSYFACQRVLSSSERKAQALREALAQLDGLKRRYTWLKELRPVWEALDRVKGRRV